jgi:hypothetical protein
VAIQTPYPNGFMRISVQLQPSPPGEEVADSFPVDVLEPDEEDEDDEDDDELLDEVNHRMIPAARTTRPAPSHRPDSPPPFLDATATAAVRARRGSGAGLSQPTTAADKDRPTTARQSSAARRRHTEKPNENRQHQRVRSGIAAICA